jgi:FecR-like protein
MRILGFALSLAVLLWGGAQAFAAPGDAIGSAVVVVNLVTAQLEKSDQRKLATGDDVRQQELIEVSPDGRGEFKLRDQTKLALGPGSQLLLDRFIYDPDISGGAIVLNLAKGAFRFITGVAAKPAYVIRTPTASITVRGTIFDVYVQADGMSWLLLIEGAVEICNENGKCRVLDEPGKLIRITPDGSIGIPVNWTELPGRQETKFESAFPFVVNAPQVDPNPIFTPEQIVLGTFPILHPRKPNDDGDSKTEKQKRQRGDIPDRHPTDSGKETTRRYRTREAEHHWMHKLRETNTQHTLKGLSVGIGHHGGMGHGR